MTEKIILERHGRIRIWPSTAYELYFYGEFRAYHPSRYYTTVAIHHGSTAVYKKLCDQFREDLWCIVQTYIETNKPNWS